MDNKPFTIKGTIIKPGTKTTLLFAAPNINTQINIDIPVHVFHGAKAGPKLFIASAIHGDELNSIEIVRRVHKKIILSKLNGTLITVPVINIYGLMIQSRYLPDRRDLNRSFPGAKTGSLAARLAHGFMEQVVSHCQYGIDLHTGALGRTNIPQLRVNLGTPGVKELALAFNAPVILNADLRPGSLRHATHDLGIPILVYEGGEALRFNELAIRTGVNGILNVMHSLRMLSSPKKVASKSKSIISQNSRWLRAPASGLVQPVSDVLARVVKKGDILANIHDPFIINPSIEVTAPFDGIVIGQTLKPLASNGDALYHIASSQKLAGVSNYIEEYYDDLLNDID
jgi:predicted deacylase